MHSVRLVFASLGVGLVFAAAAAAQTKDPIDKRVPKGNVRIELKSMGVDASSPVWLTSAGDGSGRRFVVDQVGKIFVIEDGKVLDRPFLDVSDRLVDLMKDFDERGLLGLAFHPGFDDPDSPGHRKLYTYTNEPVKGTAEYTVDLPEGTSFNNQAVIAEWEVHPDKPNRVDKSTRRELFRVDEPQFNHDGGCLVFGPDNLLYVALGDGGQAHDIGAGHGDIGNGQNIRTALGSILRVDPLGRRGKKADNGAYSIPEDNPFVGKKGVDAIYAYGLRNPYRIIRRGGNYGWRIKEGSYSFISSGEHLGSVRTEPPEGSNPDVIDPVAEYDHDDGISITGGFVYRGSAIPSLRGKYVFGDWTAKGDKPKGRLFYADLKTGDIHEFVIGEEDRPLGRYLVGFGEDSAGELYALTSKSRGPLGDDGEVLKLVPPKE